MKKTIIKLFCLIWKNLAYGLVKDQVLKTETAVDDLILETVNNVIDQLCLMNENGDLK
jgi:hypothetical protein